MPTAVTFGEIMLRLKPPQFLRFVQTDVFEATYGGGEANVAISLANYGVDARFVTALPANEIGSACLNSMRQFGVDTSHIVRQGDRLGIYFLEAGAVQRPSKVVYDRAGSSIAEVKRGDINWEAAFEGAEWFHWTGITPAISEGAADVCLEGIEVAKKMGLTVSADLNFRKNLWKWGKSASEVMPELVQHIDVAIGNEEDADKVFGIAAPGADVEGGHVEASAYRYVCEKLIERFPKLHTVCITLRGSLSASHNTWSGVMYKDGEMYVGPEYDITHIVDRVGGGDSFAGGMIYSLLAGKAPQDCVDFAVSASCLKHTIVGDPNMVTVAEVEHLIKSGGSGRVQR
ncbi:MAG: sugar kinase [candidate division WS1 bacterium]|nr:sugar kinase [candidate division WS1 bacterium]